MAPHNNMKNWIGRCSKAVAGGMKLICANGGMGAAITCHRDVLKQLLVSQRLVVHLWFGQQLEHPVFDLSSQPLVPVSQCDDLMAGC
jgi:hypothetical protein